MRLFRLNPHFQRSMPRVFRRSFKAHLTTLMWVRRSPGQIRPYTDKAKLTKSSMPKAATTGPITACQRGGPTCAGSNPLRNLANVPSPITWEA